MIRSFRTFGPNTTRITVAILTRKKLDHSWLRLLWTWARMETSQKRNLKDASKNLTKMEMVRSPKTK